MKLVSAAPASFFAAAVSLQLSAPPAVMATLEIKIPRARRFIGFLPKSGCVVGSYASHEARAMGTWPQHRISAGLSGGSDFLDTANDVHDLGIGVDIALKCF